MNKICTISEIFAYVNSKNYYQGNSLKIKILRFTPINLSIAGDMTFCSNEEEKGLKLVLSSKASLIICPLSMKKRMVKTSSTLLFVDNPRLWFIRCIKNFSHNKIIKGIHSTAIVKSKKIGKNVLIGPFSYVDTNVIIGDNTQIHGNVSIYGNTTIGKNVIIDSSTVIGTDGFGFEKNEFDKWEKFPHIGGIEIHDDVEIGSNVSIDKGTLVNTVIGKGTKIDNLVHVGHNVKIGNNCLIVAQSLLGGSCILEDNVYVSMGASIRDGIKIGTNARIGMGSVVTKNIPKNITVIGVPAHQYKKKSK